MQLLEQVKKKITSLTGCDAAYILAHAAWSIPLCGFLAVHFNLLAGRNLASNER